MSAFGGKADIVHSPLGIDACATLTMACRLSLSAIPISGG
jgi:hypothetical protein